MVQRNQNSTVTGGNSGSNLSHGDKLKIGAANYVGDSLNELKKFNAFYTRRIGTKIDDLGKIHKDSMDQLGTKIDDFGVNHQNSMTELGIDMKKSANRLGLYGIGAAALLAAVIGYTGCENKNAIDNNTGAIKNQTDVMGVYFPKIVDAIDNNTSGVSVAMGGLENTIDRNAGDLRDTMDKNNQSLVDTMNNFLSSSARSVSSLVSSIIPSKTKNSVS
ncbi:hypothetical protein EOM09_05195, partial [bacterium]|nr:hypothetical protein [bacterium]